MVEPQNTYIHNSIQSHALGRPPGSGFCRELVGVRGMFWIIKRGAKALALILMMLAIGVGLVFAAAIGIAEGGSYCSTIYDRWGRPYLTCYSDPMAFLPYPRMPSGDWGYEEPFDSYRDTDSFDELLEQLETPPAPRLLDFTPQYWGG